LADMRWGNYYEVGNSFETMKGDIENSAIRFDWARASYNISGNIVTLTHAFARTLAALGVEVSIATLVVGSDSVGLVMGNLGHQAVTNTSK